MSSGEKYKEWVKANPDKVKSYQKKWREARAIYHIARQRPYQLKKYGLTLESYDALLDTQGGLCGICGTDKPTGRWKVFAVDHCHVTGKVRGLLCNECNRGMGLLKDSASLLRKAAEYLEKQ